MRNTGRGSERKPRSSSETPWPMPQSRGGRYPVLIPEPVVLAAQARHRERFHAELEVERIDVVREHFDRLAVRTARGRAKAFAIHFEIVRVEWHVQPLRHFKNLVLQLHRARVRPEGHQLLRTVLQTVEIGLREGYS